MKSSSAALLRVKERFIKTYGLPVQTVGLAQSADERATLARIAKTYTGLDAVADGTATAGPRCPSKEGPRRTLRANNIAGPRQTGTSTWAAATRRR